MVYIQSRRSPEFSVREYDSHLNGSDSINLEFTVAQKALCSM